MFVVDEPNAGVAGAAGFGVPKKFVDGAGVGVGAAGAAAPKLKTLDAGLAGSVVVPKLGVATDG